MSVLSTHISAIILAAGQGVRYGKPKQHELLKGKEIWRWSYETFKQILDEVIVVGIDCPGGRNRRESVTKGLERINKKYVIIHDAARPLVNQRDINSLIQALTKTHVRSATLVMPITNTIISAEKGRATYLKRETLRAIATPQGFETEVLKKAHSKVSADYNAYDDCQIVKDYLGIEPYLIEGRNNLYKLTYPEDLIFLESYADKS